MSNQSQVLFRTSKRLINQFDRAAKLAGLSRNRWIERVLSGALSPSEDGKTIGLATLKATLTNQLLIEAWLATKFDVSVIQQARAAARTLSEKYYDA